MEPLLLAALAMTVPYWMVARFLGPEFPSLAGGAVGLALVVLAARKGIFVPPRPEAWEFAPRASWDRDWSGDAAPTEPLAPPARIGSLRAWAPYLVVAGWLVLTRLECLPLGDWTKSFSLFQFGVAERIGADPDWIVALQAVGGAAGNTICVHNVVAACATVGLLGREGLVIRRTVVLFLYYAGFAGLLGWWIVAESV